MNRALLLLNALAMVTLVGFHFFPADEAAATALEPISYSPRQAPQLAVMNEAPPQMLVIADAPQPATPSETGTVRWVF